MLTLCTLVLLVIGCAVGTATVRQEPEGTAYQLYFLERTLADADGGDALRAEERAIDDTGCTAEETARLLLEALLRGPKDPLLESPFPKGTSLVSVERVGTELRVDLSAAYGGLSGVELSLADYAITLTLTQLPDVARVRITVLGEELDYRNLTACCIGPQTERQARDLGLLTRIARTATLEGLIQCILEGA